MSQITPQITDTESPIIIAVGPASSGKSMIMVRIAKYLCANGYTVEPVKDYLATPEYVANCATFMQCLNSNLAMPGTVTDLLVRIRNENEKTVALYLEAPGEDYFDPEDPSRQTPLYLTNICGGFVPNKKIFITVLDLDSSEQADKSLRSDKPKRDAYAQRLKTVIHPKIGKRGKHILLYNKLDKTKFGTTLDIKPNGVKLAEKEAKKYYKTVFDGLTKKILGGFISYPNYKFEVFSAGEFTVQKDANGDDIQHYTPSGDIYPKQLWNEIMRKF